MSEEKNQIRIYDPDSMPFGELSNNSIRLMNLDGKIWTTVTNYIYSNLLITPLYRTIIQLSPPFPKMRQLAQQPWSEYRYGKHYRPEKPRNIDIEKEVVKIVANTQALQGRRLTETEIEQIRQSAVDELEQQRMNIYELYGYYFNLEKFAVVRSAVEKAYNTLISSNQDFIEVLLRTDKKPILYVSGNTLLGVNENGQGSNLIGKTLMQIRHNIQIQNAFKKKETEKTDKENRIFSIYKAYVFLNEKLQNGSDLSEFVGMSADDIADSSQLDIETKKESILQMYERGQFPEFKKEIQNPGYLVNHIRRANALRIKEMKGQERKEIALTIYMDNLILQKFPRMNEEERREAMRQLVYTIPEENRVEKYRDLRDRVYVLYNTGSLPEEVSEKIDEALKNIADPEIAHSSPSAPSAHSSPEEDKDITASTTSTASSEEDNVLKQILNSDEKGERSFLISQIQRYTGKARHKYKSWTTEHLRNILSKYEGKNPEKQPKEGAGHWKAQIKHKNLAVELLFEGTGVEKPSQETISKLIKKYNKTHPKTISVGQVFLTWVPSRVSISEEEKVEIPDYVKEHGEPIKFGAKDQGEFSVFSPLYKTDLVIDGYWYPDISTYIVVMMLTQTGYTKVKGLFVRGISVDKAISLVSRKPDADKRPVFFEPEQAIQIYDEQIMQTFRTLAETFARIAIRSKLEATDLQDLLLATKDAEIIWADPNDVFLGSGTRERKGMNIAGKILMEIREEIIEKRTSVPLKKIGDDLTLVISDPFVQRWMVSKAKDMCSTVYKVKQYVLEQGDIDQEIDSRFTRYVLNFIYQPIYQSVSKSFIVDLRSDKKSNIPVSEYFLAEMKDCPALPAFIGDAYIKELEKLKREKTERDDIFYGINPDSAGNRDGSMTKSQVYQLAKKQVKDFRRFMAQEPPPSEEQIRIIREAQDKELLEEKAKEIPFAERQRKEWIEFITRTLKPKEDWKKIRKAMKKFKAEVEDQSKKEKLIKDKWNSLTEPEIPLDKRNKMIEEFLRKQEQDYLSFHGKDRKNYTAVQLAEHDQVMKDFKNRITEANRKLKSEFLHSDSSMREMVDIYWNKIMVMFQAVMANSPDIDVDSFRQYLIDEDEHKNKQISCFNDKDRQFFKDEEENCIASALINILTGITAFKYQYADNIPFGNPDIDLAVSILLGSPVVQKKKAVVAEVKEKSEEEEEEFPGMDVKLEDVRPDFEEQMAVEEDSVPENYDYEFEVAEEGNFAFGATFGLPSSKNERISQFLRELSGQDDSIDLNELVKYFIKAVRNIKKADRPDRVNFFLHMA